MANHPPDAISDDVFFDQIFSSSCAPPPGGGLPAPMFSSLAGGLPEPEDASGGGRRFWEEAEANAEADGDCLFRVLGHVQSHQIPPNRSQALLHGQATQGSGVAAAPHQPAAPRPRVRARRGQATDPHSIAERVRRERIAERMRALQQLVPNFNKTDRAAMLDEIFDYVKFLRLQVKVLSMSRLGGTGAVAQLIADIPLQSIEGELVEGRSEQQVWEKWSNDGTERQVAKLMEEDVGAAMQFLQSKALCIMPISLATSIYHSPSHHHYNAGPPLGKPEPNAPS